MYWTPKMRMDVISASFIVASKMCRTKLILEAVSKAFPPNTRCYWKITFYSLFKQFWVTGNSKPQMINCEAKAKSIRIFDFSTLYIKLPRFDLISVLKNIVDFAFKGGNK